MLEVELSAVKVLAKIGKGFVEAAPNDTENALLNKDVLIFDFVFHYKAASCEPVDALDSLFGDAASVQNFEGLFE